MKTIVTRFLTIALLVSAIAIGAGCAAVVVGAAAGAGTAVYVSGELKAREYTSYDRAWDATMAGMNDLGYAVTEQEKGAVEGDIVARAPGDKKIKVQVRKVSGTIAEFRIRVGTWGDKAYSEAILATIKKHL